MVIWLGPVGIEVWPIPTFPPLFAPDGNHVSYL
jgi:hypothetical protein